MTRRRLTIALHWLALLLLRLMMSDGERFPVLTWAFVAATAGLAALGLARGLMTRPGPKLQGLARAVHPWQSRAMYVASAACAVIVAAEALGRPLPGPVDGSLAQMGLFCCGALHGIYHLWRHTALGDGALRIITPRALHRYL